MTIFMDGTFDPYRINEYIGILGLVLVVALTFLTYKKIKEGSKLDKIILWTVTAIGIFLEILVRIEFYYLYKSDPFIMWTHYMAPFHLCSLALIFSLLAMHTKNSVVYQVIFFWCIVGSISAIYLPNGRPNFNTVKYYHFYINHYIIMFNALYMFLVYKMALVKKSIFTSIWISFTLAIVVLIPYNIWCGSNFMFTRTSDGTPFRWFKINTIWAHFTYLLMLIVTLGIAFFSVQFFFIYLQKKREQKEKREIAM